jgi:hypothetical protein
LVTLTTDADRFIVRSMDATIDSDELRPTRDNPLDGGGAGSRSSSVVPQRRRPGRPRGRFLELDWEGRGWAMFVAGDTYSAIGVELGCSRQAVHAYSVRHGWPERRDVSGFAVPGATSPPTRLVSGCPVDALASPMDDRPDIEAILDRFIGQCAEAIAAKAMRHDSINDLERAVRLLAFAKGQADSIRQTHTTISLSVLQERHHAIRARVSDTVDDAVAGVLRRNVLPADDFEELEPEHQELEELAPVPLNGAAGAGPAPGRSSRILPIALR